MSADKEKAKTDNSMCTASFDLQKVLNVPHSEVSALYYKRMISIYNF